MNQAFARWMFADARYQKLRHIVPAYQLRNVEANANDARSKFQNEVVRKAYSSVPRTTPLSEMVTRFQKVRNNQRHRVNNKARVIQRGYFGTKVAALGKVVFKGPQGQPVTLPYPVLDLIFGFLRPKKNRSRI
jgi:hypothetical protein